jgi:drug/metabolite transporter (DMT)-like permease
VSRGNLVRLGMLALAWGASFLFIKLALEGLSPLQIVLGRVSAGAIVLWAILALRRQPMPRGRRLWAHLTALGVIANIIPFFLIGYGEERITSGLAGVLNGATPLFTLLFALGLLPEERLSLPRGLGLGLGFLGVLLVVGPWDTNPLTSSLPGQLACLGASACYAVAFVYTRRYVSGTGYPPASLAAGQLGAAAALLWLAAPLVAGGDVALTSTVVASVLALGAVGTGLAYLLYYHLIAEAGATSTSMVTYLIPVVAVALGVLVLDEPLGWNLFAGAAVVILGVALAEGRLDGVAGLPRARPRGTRPAHGGDPVEEGVAPGG